MAESNSNEQTMSELANAVLLASQQVEVARAVAEIYARLQQAIEKRKPVCDASGKCCRFEAYGHRLYVTTLELAAFVSALRCSKQTPIDRSTHRVRLPLLTENSDGCRYQIDGLCSVHAIRPFGCRIFFCDPTAVEWQQNEYENTLQELKREHDRLGVPYFYVEWRSALRAIERALLDAIPATLNNASG